MATELLDARGVAERRGAGVRAAAEAGRPVRGRARAIPDRAVRRDEAARRDGALVPARSLAADRRRDHVRARRLDPEGRVPDPRRVPGPRLREEHDRHHPRLSILYQIADTISSCTPASWPRRRRRDIVEAPRHPYTQMLLSSLPEVGVRYSEKRLTGIPGRPPSLLDPPTDAGSGPGARSPSRSARSSRRSGDRTGHIVACWKVAGDAELDTRCKVYRVGAFGGGRARPCKVSFEVRRARSCLSSARAAAARRRSAR